SHPVNEVRVCSSGPRQYGWRAFRLLLPRSVCLIDHPCDPSRQEEFRSSCVTALSAAVLYNNSVRGNLPAPNNFGLPTSGPIIPGRLFPEPPAPARRQGCAPGPSTRRGARQPRCGPTSGGAAGVLEEAAEAVPPVAPTPPSQTGTAV